MAEITAAMVKELREKTGAGMMDCKAALGEASGNIDAAVDWLRKKGLSKAAKKADRCLLYTSDAADDLKKLTGVSPAIEKKLNDLGIFHYSQIAELSADAAHNVGEEVGLPGRVQGWVAKAKELTAE